MGLILVEFAMRLELMVVLSVILLLLFLVWLVSPTPLRAHTSVRPYTRTSRRPGAAYGVDLRVRRAWFAEGDDGEGDGGAEDKVDLSGLPPHVVDYIKTLKDQIADVKHESIGRRKYIDRIEPEYEALKKAQEQNLMDQGKYKDLYENTLPKIAELEMKAKRADAYEAQIKAANEAKMAQIPDDWKPMVESVASDLSPEKLTVWLDQNMSRFTTPTAPDIGAGESTGGGKPVVLTPEQEEARKAAGMTQEEYAKYLNRAVTK